MEICVQLSALPIADRIVPPAGGAAGAWLEFRGVVRGEENDQFISALEYEAYPEMAEREIRRLLTVLAARHSCLAATVIHRVGMIPVGETAIYVGVAGKHRGEALALLTEFMNCLKQDVPIWKRRAVATAGCDHRSVTPNANAGGRTRPLQLDAALAEIHSHVQPRPGVKVSLAESGGRVLREAVRAPEDSPAGDRSTRDGYAILMDDAAESFSVVGAIHAADWKPRRLKPGEAVRVATGASLPCENLRVVMQEDVERAGDTIKILRPANAMNVRRCGEEWRAGDTLLGTGTKLDAGALSLLAAIGWVEPLVSPKLSVLHLTTGDEIIPPAQTPMPGQIRDSNSILISSLLRPFQVELEQAHLPEDFGSAKLTVANRQSAIERADLVLVSGGASVGEKDFTRPLLEWLGYEIVFSRLNLRPGAPLIFGVAGGSGTSRSRIAFGLPGNPVSHFVCFQLFVTAALQRLTGGKPPEFQRGVLAEKLEDAPNPRETLWPARLNFKSGCCELTPLRWSSSGDVRVLPEATALVCVPANVGALAAGAQVQFLSA